MGLSATCSAQATSPSINETSQRSFKGQPNGALPENESERESQNKTRRKPGFVVSRVD